MLSHNKKHKGIVLTDHLFLVEGYFITWYQMVSKEGDIYGIGSFQHKSQETARQQRRGGNWSKTLQKRIKTRHEKGKDWRN